MFAKRIHSAPANSCRAVKVKKTTYLEIKEAFPTQFVYFTLNKLCVNLSARKNYASV